MDHFESLRTKKSVLQIKTENLLLRNQIADLTEELEQCKIELLEARDRIHDLEAQIHS